MSCPNPTCGYPHKDHPEVNTARLAWHKAMRRDSVMQSTNTGANIASYLSEKDVASMQSSSRLFQEDWKKFRPLRAHIYKEFEHDYKHATLFRKFDETYLQDVKDKLGPYVYADKKREMMDGYEHIAQVAMSWLESNSQTPVQMTWRAVDPSILVKHTFDPGSFMGAMCVYIHYYIETDELRHFILMEIAVRVRYLPHNLSSAHIHEDIYLAPPEYLDVVPSNMLQIYREFVFNE
jgi:hypothetical protein